MAYYETPTLDPHVIAAEKIVQQSAPSGNNRAFTLLPCSPKIPAGFCDEVGQMSFLTSQVRVGYCKGV